jgi:palmitoyl-protein thioesterase
VLVRNSDDLSVVPNESAHFEYISKGKYVPLQEQEIYKNDLIGLKTMHEEGRLFLYTIPGDHDALDEKWFLKEIVPFFKNNGTKKSK